jgi:hypothetical protein
MATWAERKLQYQALVNQLNVQSTNAEIQRLVNTLNVNLTQYSRGGPGQNPGGQAQLTQAQQSFSMLQDLEQAYVDLNKRISTDINQTVTSSDVDAKQRMIGELQQEIATLQTEVEEYKKDADTSKTRQTSVETTRQTPSYYQGFSGRIGFTRPLKQMSIPILLGFGIMILFMSGLMLREFFISPDASFTTGLPDESVVSLLTSSRFYAFLAGITFVGVVMGILAYTGRLGTNLN